MNSNADLETRFLEIITEERILRLNKAMEMVYGGNFPSGVIYSEEGVVVFVDE